jgi:putative hydrolase of the HAD superfamily
VKLEKLGLIDHFDFMVSSEEVNIEKPHTKLFACCIEKSNVLAEECLFIGDSLRKDYQGALDAGMQALWYCPDPAAAQAHPQIRKISSFDELRQMFL